MPIETLALSAGGAIAGTKALQSVLGDAYGTLKGKSKAKLKAWQREKKIAELYKNIATVRKVKTIWQVDKEVDLTEFYYPPTIQADEKPVKVNTVYDLPHSGNILLQGIIGQGKSILLRYLCSQELYMGKRIPLFFELRRLTGEERLHDALVDRMKVLGFDATKTDFNALAKNGKIILFLDAFDEVPEDKAAQVVTDLETLCERFGAMQVIVTSRPDNQLTHSPNFRVFSLSELTPKDIPRIIHRLTDDSDLGLRLIESLKKNKSVQGILRTPLMVTLLAISYQAYEKLPDRLSEFYEDLFDILISRHDRTKPGFTRKKKCGLNDNSIRDVFDSFCFLTRRDDKGHFLQKTIVAYAKDAVSSCSHNCDAADFINDMCQVTNLILKEGKEFQFIHRSVQEFHSASYINGLRDNAQSQHFYDQMLEGHWAQWRQELDFLRDIDPLRFSKYFLRADAERFFMKYAARIPKSWKKTPKALAKRLMDEITICMTFSDSAQHPEMIWSQQYDDTVPGWTFNDSLQHDGFWHLVAHHLKHDKLYGPSQKNFYGKLKVSDAPHFGQNRNVHTATATQLYDAGLLKTATLNHAIHDACSRTFQSYTAALKLIDDNARNTPLLDL